MSEELIRRSDAIKAMEQRYQDILRIFKRKVKDGEKAIALDMIGCIKSLPSADIPQGEWIGKAVFHNKADEPFVEKWQSIMCSVCHKYHTTPYIHYFNNYNFCPNCGARMKGADDEV